jgi:hypothetical protein
MIAINSDLANRINVLIDHYILITDSPEIVSRLNSYKILVNSQIGMTGSQFHI